MAFGHLFFNQPLDGALCSCWGVCFELRVEGVWLSSECYDRESDLYLGLSIFESTIYFRRNTVKGELSGLQIVDLGYLSFC